MRSIVIAAVVEDIWGYADQLAIQIFSNISYGHARSVAWR